MTKVLKIAGILLGLIVTLFIIGMILLVTFVNPNRLKPLLAAKVKEHTHRELIMDGDMSWTFFPYLGVKTGHMSLSNPPGFNEKIFAEFSGITVGVQLMPLFHGRVQSSGILLKGMKLHLIKNAAGQVNWVFPHATDANEQQLEENSQTRQDNIRLAVSMIDIVNAQITWADESIKQNVAITNFNFHAKNISLTQPIPISTDFVFTAQNPNVSGSAKLTSNIAMNLEKQIYSLRNVDFNVQTIKKDQKINLHITGDLIADMLQQTLQWTNFKANVADLNLVGKVSVLQLTSAPQASGHFEIQPFDLKNVLEKLGQDTTVLQLAKNVRGSLDFSASSKAVEATGEIKADQLEANHIKMNDLEAHLKLQNGTLQLTPVTANLYQGELNANVNVALNKPIITYQLQSKLSNVQAGPLLKDLGAATKKLSLSGLANADLQLTTQGSDAQTILSNLNGNSHINLANGKIEGIDLGYYVDTASALLQRQSPSGSDSQQTSFGTLTATAVIQNGVVTNNDLLLDATRFDTKGQGTINLVNQNIDYSLQASLKESQVSVLKNYPGLMIPIRITGSLNDPRVRLDTEALLKLVAKQQIEKHKDQIQQKIEENISGKAGDLLKNLIGN